MNYLKSIRRSNEGGLKKLKRETFEITHINHLSFKPERLRRNADFQNFSSQLERSYLLII